MATGGLGTPGPDGTLVTLAFPTSPGQFVFLLGLVITFALYVLKIRAALIISILVTTVIAILAGVHVARSQFTITPNFSTSSRAPTSSRRSPSSASSPPS